MKKNKKHILNILKPASLLCIALCMVNCQREHLETLEKDSYNNKGYEIKNGALVFDNLNSFTGLINDFKNDESQFNRHLSSVSNESKNQFVALTPNYNIENHQAIDLYIERKKAEYTAQAKSYKKAGLTTKISEIDDEDDFIADPHFAALLNQDRELIIENIIYKYTPFGMFSTITTNKEELDNVINNFTPDFNSYEAGITIDLGNGISYFPQNYLSKNSIEEKYEYPLEKKAEDDIDEDRFDDDGGESIGSSGSGNSNNSYPPPHISTFPSCNSLKQSLLNKIVGPSITCEQYWETTKRVKTKVWNQNYGIYSSIGISVRSQSRKLRIWWANKTDELILGYNTFTFDYPWNNQLNANILGTFPTANNYTYRYKGFVINQQGQYVNPGGNLWNTSVFPIKAVNDNWLNIQVYLPIYNNNVGVTLSTKDINSFAEGLLKSTIKDYSSKLKDLNKDTPTAIEILMAEKVRFIHHNWKRHKTDASKIIEVFDWNTGQITISGTPGGGTGSGPRPGFPNLNAKSYNLVLGDVYGIARRGKIWKGSRIEYKED